MAAFDGIIGEAAERLAPGASAERLVREVLALVTGGLGGFGGFVERLYEAGFGNQVTAWFNGETASAVPRHLEFEFRDVAGPRGK